MLHRVQVQASNIQTAFHSLASGITSYATQSNTLWPYLTMPNWQVRALNSFQLTNAVAFGFSPLVSGTNQSEWESYVADYRLPDYGSDPQSFDGPCIWLDLDSRRCKHHEFRPRVCRDFEIGSSGCRQWRRYYRDKISVNRPDAN